MQGKPLNYHSRSLLLQAEELLAFLLLRLLWWNGHGGRVAMGIRKGEVFRHSSNGVSLTVKKIVNNMVVLESQDGKREIGLDTLKLKSFYLKEEQRES
jgi:hypothetical protein